MIFSELDEFLARFPESGDLLETLLNDLKSIRRNPCIRCHSTELDPEYVGSGFCSLDCLVADRDSPDPDRAAYATLMMGELLKRDLHLGV